MGVVDENTRVVDENLRVVDRPSVGVVDEMGSSMGRRWVVDDDDFFLDSLITDSIDSVSYIYVVLFLMNTIC